jgi:hypothetical protein
MAYKNIVFVKLEKRLLNDWRYYMMSEKSQLNYVKLLMLAGETYNKIPLLATALKLALRTSQDESEIENSIKEIMRNFPKFKRGKNFYYIDEFETKTNWVSPKQSPSNRRAIAKQVTDKEKEKEKEKEKDSNLIFLESLKKNPSYTNIDINHELSKMDAWLSAHPGRKKTKRFIVNWLNKVEVPLGTTPLREIDKYGRN